MTRIPELRAAGVLVALGQDCVMDPWYGLGGADMLDVAHMAVHAQPMTSREAIRWSLDGVTENPAKVMGLEDYGLRVGAHADFVVLQAAYPIEAVRMRAQRLAVIRRGKVIASAPPRIVDLDLPGRPKTLDAADYAPRP
jgi:cytosine deaminase